MGTLYTVTVDTEEEWDWHAGWPTQDLAVSNIQQLPRFQDLCDRHGAATTYFTNHAVLNSPDALPVLLEMAQRDRVEIGMHIHPWNTPPLVHTGPVTVRETYLHNLPGDVIRAKLQSVYDLFAAAGLRPTSFRGGRYSSGPVIQAFLREKRFLADSSAVPYTVFDDAGAPDYRERGPWPVRLPPRRAGELSLWELPLTRGFTRGPAPLWRRFYQTVQTTRLSRLRLIGIVERLHLVRRLWLNFEQHPPEEILQFLHALRRRPLPFVCFTLHSSSLAPGLSPYTPTAADVERLFQAVDSVLGTVAQWPEFEPVTMTAAAQRLESEYHARTRHQSA